MPNIAVEVRRGVICFDKGRLAGDGLLAEVAQLFGRCGMMIGLPEELIDAYGATGVAPAYVALIAEAWTDAGIAHGVPADKAAQIVTEAIAGSAELLRARGHDTLQVRLRRRWPRRRGVTAQGLAALERGGVRAAFRAALDAVMAHRK